LLGAKQNRANCSILKLGEKMEFRKRLKELRIEKGMTQVQLAAKLNVTDATIRGWENRGSEPNYETLYVIAKLFDVTVGQLLGTEDY
jgi:transcriptional regulator with XRE-family HTH domain